VRILSLAQEIYDHARSRCCSCILAACLAYCAIAAKDLEVKTQYDFCSRILSRMKSVTPNDGPDEVRTRIADPVATRFNHYTMATHNKNVISIDKNITVNNLKLVLLH
jgi:hypothetical protein